MPPSPYDPPSDPSYIAPNAVGFEGGGPVGADDHRAASALRVPVMGLLISASVFLLLLVFGIVFNIWMLASGRAAELGDSELRMGHETVVQLRLGFALALLLANLLVLIGAIQMLRHRSYGLGLLSAFVAAVPCLGPCYFLGIPFGIWTIILLQRPDIKALFRR